tara:strand:- start:112 stop:327 length:216 start_codon:yes stop_codon:yes gene_type:complete
MIVINNNVLRQVIGDKNEELEAKVSDCLDEFSREFILKSLFLVLSTSDAESRCDASPPVAANFLYKYPTFR